MKEVGIFATLGRAWLPVAALLVAALLVSLGACSPAQTEVENSVLHSFQRGNQAFAAEDYSRAIGHYQRAVALDNGVADLHYNLGLAYYQVGEYQAAVKAYLQAIALDGGFADAHHNLALAYDKLYEPNAAHLHYNTYRQLTTGMTPGQTPPLTASVKGAPGPRRAGAPPGKPNQPPANPYKGSPKWWMLDPAKALR